MTTFLRETVSRFHPNDRLLANLADGIAEQVTWASSPEARSAALQRLVEEIYDTMEWRLRGSTGYHAELASLRRIVDEVKAHEDRMHGQRDDAARSDRQATP